MDREILYADEGKGMIYTDGTTYGSEIYLAENMSADNFYQIPLSEYEEKFKVEPEDIPTDI